MQKPSGILSGGRHSAARDWAWETPVSRGTVLILISRTVSRCIREVVAPQVGLAALAVE